EAADVPAGHFAAQLGGRERVGSPNVLGRPIVVNYPPLAVALWTASWRLAQTRAVRLEEIEAQAGPRCRRSWPPLPRGWAMPTGRRGPSLRIAGCLPDPARALVSPSFSLPWPPSPRSPSPPAARAHRTSPSVAPGSAC